MATSFPSFPLLPKELRLAIWNLALEPRIVELCFDVLDQADEGAGSGNEEEVEGEDQYEEPRNEQDGPFVVKEDNAVEENENEDEDEEQAKEKSEVKDDSHVEIDTRDVKDDGDDENADVEEGRNSNRRHEDVSLDVANHDRDTAIDDVDNISETSEHTYSRALGSGQFYSPSPLPSLLRVNSEARSAALAAALNGLPVASNQEDVYYNPEIDILYFPAGCWQEDIMGFEQAISEEVKESIRRIALENLMWMSYWEEGTVNGQITIEQFKNVKEFIFAMRELTQCGCCISFDGPEGGLVEFVDIDIESEVEEADAALEEDADTDSGTGTIRLNDELRREALGLGVVEDEQAPDTKAKKEKKAGNVAYTKRYVDRLKDEFLKIKESHPDWNVPEARIVRLKRDGEFAGDP